MPDRSDTRRCTIELADRTFCDAPRAPRTPFPICSRHAILLFQTMKAHLEQAQSDAEVLAAVAAEQALELGRRALVEAMDGDPIVYYVQVGNDIKIGTTGNLHRRLTSLPAGARVLGTEPGDFNLEAERLRQFAEYRCHGKEWFHPAPQLLTHIASLSRAHKQAAS